MEMEVKEVAAAGAESAKIETIQEAQAAMSRWQGVRFQRKAALVELEKKQKKLTERAEKLRDEQKELLNAMDETAKPFSERLAELENAMLAFFSANPGVLGEGKTNRQLTGGVWGDGTGFQIGLGKFETDEKTVKAIGEAALLRDDGKIVDAVAMLGGALSSIDKIVAEQDEDGIKAVLDLVVEMIIWTPKADAKYAKSMLESNPSLSCPEMRVAVEASFVVDGNKVKSGLEIPGVTDQR